MCVCAAGESDSQDESTALMYATKGGHANCVRLLINAGADKDAKSKVRVGRGLAPSGLVFMHASLFVSTALRQTSFRFKRTVTCSFPSRLSFFSSFFATLQSEPFTCL
jgi:hypothetical protein